MSNIFYKAKFTVESREESEDILWILVVEIKRWLTNKWNKNGHQFVEESNKYWSHFKNGGKLYDREHENRVYAESYRYKNDEVFSWACRIVENPEMGEDYAQREWVTEIGFQQYRRGRAEISYVVTYSDMPGYIGFCAAVPNISLPRVIRMLLNHKKLKCYIGSDEITDRAIKLNPGDYPEFERLLLKKEREVPVIYISPQRNCEDEGSLLCPCEEMAQGVAANAIVYYSLDLEFTKEMKYMGESRYGCANGSIRLYRPNINLDNPNDACRHRLISATFISTYGKDNVLDIFRKALAQDFHYYDKMFRIENCQELLRLDQRKEYIKSIRDKSSDEIDEAQKAFLEESDEHNETKKRLSQKEQELNVERMKNQNLDFQIEDLKKKAQKALEIEGAIKNIRTIANYPDTAQEIAKYFEKIYPERIAFTQRAYQSMDECITKREIIWSVFYRMVTDLYDLVHDEPARAYKLFEQKTGWGCARGQSKMVHRDSSLAQKYIDIYQGQKINIEDHIAIGNRDNDSRSIRVYFSYNPRIVDKIVVGSCGVHIDNYTTRKIK